MERRGENQEAADRPKRKSVWPPDGDGVSWGGNFERDQRWRDGERTGQAVSQNQLLNLLPLRAPQHNLHFFAPKVALSTEFLALKHYSSIFIQSSNLVCFSWKSHAVGKTAQSLTYSIMEKPPTRWDDCLNMLLSCFRKIMSAL